jgi:hypothetical protein
VTCTDSCAGEALGCVDAVVTGTSAAEGTGDVFPGVRAESLGSLMGETP